MIFGWVFSLLFSDFKTQGLKSIPIVPKVTWTDGANTTCIWSPTSMMMLYKNTITIVHSPDGDTDFFDVDAENLQGDTLATTFVYTLPKLRT